MIYLPKAKLTLRAPKLRRAPKLDAPKRKSVRRGHGKHWKMKPAVIIRRSGREVCNLATDEGWTEYRWRVLLMWVRQDGICCDCRLPLLLREATFEHEDGRGMGSSRRDDRVALFDEDGRFKRHLNGAAHGECNRERGSRRTEIYRGNNCFIELHG